MERDGFRTKMLKIRRKNEMGRSESLRIQETASNTYTVFEAPFPRISLYCNKARNPNQSLNLDDQTQIWIQQTRRREFGVPCRISQWDQFLQTQTGPVRSARDHSFSKSPSPRSPLFCSCRCCPWSFPSNFPDTPRICKRKGGLSCKNYCFLGTFGQRKRERERERNANDQLTISQRERES